MRSRAVLLPTIGDPVLVRLWIRQYEKCFKDSIDNLYVIINSNLPADVMNDVREQFRNVGAVEVAIYDRMITHGEALKQLLEASTEDLIMLIEDDCFVFNRDVVDKYFRGIERGDYDLAGSPRMSCATEICDMALTRWGLNYREARDVGPNFWPNCLFVKCSDLLKTDLNFDSKEFKAGEYIKPLNYTMKETGYGDTMVWLSLQLRDLGLRIKEIPQYHGSTYDVSHRERGHGLWDGHAPWTHTGSSSSLQNLLDGTSQINVVETDEKLELERRLAWWKLSYDMFKNNLLGGYSENRAHIMDRIIRVNGLSVRNISYLVDGYMGLI